MMVRTRDFASSTTQVRDHQSTRRLDNHVSGQAEFMVSQVYQVQPPSPLAYRRQSACPPVWLHAFARSLAITIVVLIITDMPPMHANDKEARGMDLKSIPRRRVWRDFLGYRRTGGQWRLLPTAHDAIRRGGEVGVLASRLAHG